MNGVYYLCALSRRPGCFNILLNVAFLLTLTGEPFSPESQALLARLKVKFLGCAQRKATGPTLWVAPEPTGDRTGTRGWVPAPQHPPWGRPSREGLGRNQRAARRLGTSHTLLPNFARIQNCKCPPSTWKLNPETRFLKWAPICSPRPSR